MNPSLPLVWLLIGQITVAPEQQSDLRALLSARRANLSDSPPLQLEWRLLEHRGDIAKLNLPPHVKITNPDVKVRTLYATSRHVRDQQLLIYHGDEEGVFSPWQVGEPLSCAERRYLLRDGKQWLYIEDSLNANISDPINGDVLDVRELVLDPLPSGLMEKIQTTDHRYETSEQGSIQEIAEFLSDSECLRWWIDHAKGGATVRCGLYREGEAVTEVRTTYKNWSGWWLPQKVTRSRNGRVVDEFDVFECRFGSWDDISPNELGLVAGVAVHGQAGTEPDIWDGAQLVPAQDFMKLVHNRKVNVDEYQKRLEEQHKNPLGRFPKGFAKLIDFGLKKTDDPQLWEEYVRRFIMVNRLDADQSERAWMALRPIQERVLGYLERHQPEFRRAANMPGDASRESELARLKRPVQEGFEELKKDLDRLARAK